MADPITGGCLCGAVRYEATAEPFICGDCYCVDCRRSSGTANCTHAGVPADAFTMTGQVTSYDRPADSGSMVSRKFCPTCGGPVYSTNSSMPGNVFLRASSLDDMERVKPQMSVYASRAPSWRRPAAEIPAFDEMPPAPPRPAP